MSIIGRSTIDTINQTFNVRFTNIFHSDAANLHSMFTAKVSTGSKTNNVSLLTALPKIKRNTGSREYQVTRALNKAFDLEKYDALTALPEDLVIFDQDGIIQERLNAVVKQGARIPETLATDELVQNATGVDGVALFSASHPYGPSAATQSNTTTSALASDTLDSAMVAGASLRDEKGEPLHVSYDMLMVGPKLASLATDLTGSNKLLHVDNTGVVGGQGSTTTNVVGATTLGTNVYGGGSLGVVVNPRLVGTYDDYWYLFDTKKEQKPVILFEGKAATPITPDDAADVRFHNGQLVYGVEGYWAPAPGAWWTGYAGIL